MSYHDLGQLVTFRPLEWPVPGGRRQSPFRGSWTSTVRLLAKELRAHGARGTVLEVDIAERDLRLDGLPCADRRAPTSGIVLSFEATAVAGSPKLRYEVGTFWDWQDNLRAIALGLEALRAVDRYGVTKRGEQYAGWRSRRPQALHQLKPHGGRPGRVRAVSAASAISAHAASSAFIPSPSSTAKIGSGIDASGASAAASPPRCPRWKTPFPAAVESERSNVTTRLG